MIYGSIIIIIQVQKRVRIVHDIGEHFGIGLHFRTACGIGMVGMGTGTGIIMTVHHHHLGGSRQMLQHSTNYEPNAAVYIDVAYQNIVQQVAEFQKHDGLRVRYVIKNAYAYGTVDRRGSCRYTVCIIYSEAFYVGYGAQHLRS